MGVPHEMAEGDLRFLALASDSPPVLALIEFFVLRMRTVAVTKDGKLRSLG